MIFQFTAHVWQAESLFGLLYVLRSSAASPTIAPFSVPIYLSILDVLTTPVVHSIMSNTLKKLESGTSFIMVMENSELTKG